MNRSPLQRLYQLEQVRPSLPGEHLVTLGVGVLVLLMSRHASTMTGRIAAMAAGGALLYRAASGRDGIRKLIR
jgi:uncharacterized membrane protein